MKEKKDLQVIRETVSDTEEESHGRLSLSRKVEMLNVRDANEEFEIKTQCLRRKSLDFEREKAKVSFTYKTSTAALENLTPEDDGGQ